MILCALVLSVGLIGTSYAHKSQVVGDYKVETGWAKEPPVAGSPNSIEVTITKVATSDKKPDTIKQDPQKNSNADKTKAEKKPAAKVKKTPTENTKPQKLSGVSGLSKNLEVTLKLNDKKTSLKMTEDPKIKGRYLAPFTPDKEGYPTVHIYTKISKQDIEVTLHPEKIITAKSK